MYKLLCKGDSGGWFRLQDIFFFMSLKITFSHYAFILFFLYLIKVEHPSTKLQVLSRSARLEKGTDNIKRGRDAHI